MRKGGISNFPWNNPTGVSAWATWFLYFSLVFSLVCTGVYSLVGCFLACWLEGASFFLPMIFWITGSCRGSSKETFLVGVSCISFEEGVLLITLKKACLTIGNLSSSNADKLILTFLNSSTMYSPICSISASKDLPMDELVGCFCIWLGYFFLSRYWFGTWGKPRLLLALGSGELLKLLGRVEVVKGHLACLFVKKYGDVLWWNTR